ncbi:hypothetical protein OS493_006151 [Desmophyllum pertusum]|uniref:Uncharacterized protein n=1 Tax=Desmophyllum pertusum TaxID=174260 RepID=A0A9X0A533_9CNID|nr:hypothetical protein OS493_006151 [Desmophyllum pertusum]
MDILGIITSKSPQDVMVKRDEIKKERKKESPILSAPEFYGCHALYIRNMYCLLKVHVHCAPIGTICHDLSALLDNNCTLSVT